MKCLTSVTSLQKCISNFFVCVKAGLSFSIALFSNFPTHLVTILAVLTLNPIAYNIDETKSIQQLNDAKRTKSTLAAHVWDVRDSGLSPTVEWSILLRSSVYEPGHHWCGICLGEVTLICFADPEESLNKRTELRQGCRHKAKFKLNKFHRPPPAPNIQNNPP